MLGYPEPSSACLIFASSGNGEQDCSLQLRPHQCASTSPPTSPWRVGTLSERSPESEHFSPQRHSGPPRCVISRDVATGGLSGLTRFTRGDRAPCVLGSALRPRLAPGFPPRGSPPRGARELRGGPESRPEASGPLRSRSSAAGACRARTRSPCPLRHKHTEPLRSLQSLRPPPKAPGLLPSRSLGVARD